jgi:hypothetical protein
VRPGRWEQRRRGFLVQGEAFFDRHGGKAVFLARWLPALRVTGAWLAGASRMPWPRFVLWNMLGGVGDNGCARRVLPRKGRVSPRRRCGAHAPCGPRPGGGWCAARPKAPTVRGKPGLQLMIQLPLSVIGEIAFGRARPPVKVTIRGHLANDPRRLRRRRAHRRQPCGEGRNRRRRTRTSGCRAAFLHAPAGSTSSGCRTREAPRDTQAPC